MTNERTAPSQRPRWSRGASLFHYPQLQAELEKLEKIGQVKTAGNAAQRARRARKRQRKSEGS